MSNPFADFFAALTPGTKVALPYLQSASLSARTPTQILEDARQAGLSFRTQQALDVISIARGNVAGSRQLRITPDDVVLDPAGYGHALGDIAKNYSYYVSIDGLDTRTGLDADPITVTSWDPLSKRQILDKAASYLEQKQGRYPFLVVNGMSVDMALKAPGID